MARAALLRRIRGFFEQRDVLEVETPLLCSAPASDPGLLPLRCGERWLQTSPEYAMKRLLAADSGPIFQLCKAFRGDEVGARHNPEFTMLEWYRPGYTLSKLIEEVAYLVGGVLDRTQWQVITYAELFERHLALNPHSVTAEDLERCARDRIELNGTLEHRDGWLDLLFTHVIEPAIENEGLVFVRDFPASQASLARLRTRGQFEVADRFELYVDGVELANGYRELTDPVEQRSRFEKDEAALAALGESPRPRDTRLLYALADGLPDCSGVALGVDRLFMLARGLAHFSEAVSFDWARS